MDGPNGFPHSHCTTIIARVNNVRTRISRVKGATLSSVGPSPHMRATAIRTSPRPSPAKPGGENEHAAIGRGAKDREPEQRIQKVNKPRPCSLSSLRIFQRRTVSPQPVYHRQISIVFHHSGPSLDSPQNARRSRFTHRTRRVRLVDQDVHDR